jgi:hypothetical protein
MWRSSQKESELDRRRCVVDPPQCRGDVTRGCGRNGDVADSCGNNGVGRSFNASRRYVLI